MPTVDALRRELLFKLRYAGALRYEYEAQAIESGQWRADQLAHYAETHAEIKLLSEQIAASEKARRLA